MTLCQPLTALCLLSADTPQHLRSWYPGSDNRAYVRSLDLLLGLPHLHQMATTDPDWSPETHIWIDLSAMDPLYSSE